ncbi:MAG: preprotein translocase subunit SecE [Candidatus Nomurabacteria bacterium]|nr:MAG: preprotein translocase subunit SecE [Candidatus Nomurabacteria bacterium]
MAFHLVNYIRESRDELKKVVWPTRGETTRHTLMVIAVSLGVAAFLGIVDYTLNFLLETFLT